MTDTLVHRGPDDSGVWVDPQEGIGLGHRRLAIVDLSVDGAQPMLSHCGRYVVVFNGEVYNYRKLRLQLERAGEQFRGHSDTEVMLAAIVAWGLLDALGQFNGMFALALWDRHERVLTLARDRIGKKPLYYGQTAGRLFFGSELKALRPVGAWDAGIDDEGAAAFFRYGFVPGEHSILRGVRKLLPGHLAVFRSPGEAPAITPFWRLEEMIGRAQAAPYQGDRREAESELATRLGHAVDLRCQADVPVGAFLSGGVDSSLVVALMASRGHAPVHTYTIGFSDSAYDESADARRIAAVLGCTHREARLDPDDLPGLAAAMPAVYDEPFADVSQIPTLLVSRLAREQVTVCLSGDGGDEGFGGYHRHFTLTRQWPRLAAIPWGVRRGLAALLRMPDQDALAWLLGRITGMRTPREKWAKLLAALAAQDLDELYAALLSQAQVEAAAKGVGTLRRPQSLPRDLGPARRVMAMDTLAYLPDDVLVKTDRASMAVGLELRNPLLDVDVLEFAWRLPEAWLVDAGKGKRILRRVLAGHLPEDYFERPKMGFAVPIGDWLRGPLTAWAESLLLSGTADTFLDGREIMRRWQEHQAGAVDHGHWLWRVLMWRSWREYWHV